MNKEPDETNEGKSAAVYYYKSMYPSYKNKHVRAEDVIKFFLPPVEEQAVQIAMPLPKTRQEWLQGFKEEQANILSEWSESTNE